jgi:SRSO17 transposase
LVARCAGQSHALDARDPAERIIIKGQDWQEVKLDRQTLPPQTWKAKAAQVHLQHDGKPTDRTYWLIVAKNDEIGETKYFVSNAPPKTSLLTLLKVAFSRWNVKHTFRLAKTEIGFGHFEGRSYKGLLRHMIVSPVVLLFVAEETDKLRGEKPRDHDGADRPRAQLDLPEVAGSQKALACV